MLRYEHRTRFDMSRLSSFASAGDQLSSRMNGTYIFHGEMLIHDDRDDTLTASRVQGGGKRGPTSVLIPSYFIHYADAFRISASSSSSASDYSL